MAYGVLGAWRRHRLALAVGAALLALVPATAVAASPSDAPPGWKTVGYEHVSLAVPAGWAVHDLAAQPSACARTDVAGLYLGHQGEAAACPAQALGHSDAVHVEPLDASVQRFSVQATSPATVGGMPMRVNPDPAASRTLIAAIDDAGLLVRVSYRDDASLPGRILSTLRFSGATPSSSDPVQHAPAMPAFAPHATPGVFTGSGFDTCAAPSTSNMRAWVGTSPYQSVGIYVGGTNAACLGGNLNASWVDTVTGMGWRLFPIYVGLQAPCANQSGLASIDAGSADAQGVQNADDAVTNLRALGIGPGNPVFFDMEAYQSGCAGTVLTFLGGWVRELRAQGYLSGVYSGVDTGVTYMLGTQPAWPDELWFARWDNTPTTGDPEIPAGMWSNHQRMKQYQGGHNEGYNSTIINIDSDSVDATLVGHSAG